MMDNYLEITVNTTELKRRACTVLKLLAVGAISAVMAVVVIGMILVATILL